MLSSLCQKHTVKRYHRMWKESVPSSC